MADLGCDYECVNRATANHWRRFDEIMPTCGCGTDAWRIQTTEVNVLAAIENVYGDLENLTEADNQAIKAAMIRFEKH